MPVVATCTLVSNKIRIHSESRTDDQSRVVAMVDVGVHGCGMQGSLAPRQREHPTLQACTIQENLPANSI